MRQNPSFHPDKMPIPGRVDEKYPPAPETVVDHPAYNAITALAREQGRATPDGIILDGTSWQSGDTQTVITGHRKLEQDRVVVTKQHHVWSSTRGAGYHGPPKETKIVTTTTWLHIVESRDAWGDVVAADTLTDEQLQNSLDEAADQEGDLGLRHVHLPPFAGDIDRPPQNPERLVVTLVGSDEDFIEEIDKQRLAYGLDSWDNLTWNNGDRRCRIVRDAVVQPIVDGRKQPPVRRWLVETTEVDEAGHKRTVALDWSDGVSLRNIMKDLMQDVRRATPVNAPAADAPYLWFEREQVPVTAGGQQPQPAAEAAGGTGQPDNHELSLEEAVELLSYPDVLGDRERELVKAELSRDPDTKKDAEMLQELVADVGTQRVFGHASQLRAAYLVDARQLGILNADPTGLSTSWALLELARLHHYSKIAPNEVPRSMAGLVGPADPLGNDDEARYKLSEIIDRRIGREYLLRALRLEQIPEAVGLKVVDDDIKQLKRLRQGYSIDHNFTNQLQPFIKEKIVSQVLGPVARGEVGWPEWPVWIAVGRLLRMSVGH